MAERRLPHLDAIAATHQENYKESQLYTLGGKQRTRAPSPDAELEYMFVMSMVVQWDPCGQGFKSAGACRAIAASAARASRSAASTGSASGPWSPR